MFDDIFANTITMAIAITALTCVCILGTFAFGMLLYWMYGRRGKKKAEALMETGQQGEATVLSLEDTGVLINNNPRVRIGLDVRIPGYEPYRVVKTMTMPMIRMSQVQVGAVVAVIADPSEPDNPDKVGLLLQ